MTIEEIVERECPCNCPDANRFAGGHTIVCPWWHRDAATRVAKAFAEECAKTIENGATDACEFHAAEMIRALIEPRAPGGEKGR